MKSYICQECGVEIRRVKVRKENEEVEVWMIGKEVIKDYERVLKLQDMKCPLEGCTGMLKARFSCLECRWLAKTEEEVVKRFQYKLYKKKEIVYTCIYPDSRVRGTVRNFEKAANCDYYFNPKKTTTLDRWG